MRFRVTFQNKQSDISFKKKLKTSVSLLFLLSLISFYQPVNAQQNYEVSYAPDIWYNSVDGIRVGVRMRGKVPGSFKQGPHRLDAGLWLSTFIPASPVSYYFSLTEPITAISDFQL